VAVLTASVFDFDQMTNDQMTAGVVFWFQIKKIMQSIREPQSKCFTFALSN